MEINQMDQVSSGLPEAAAPTHRYRKRDGASEGGQKINLIESKTESDGTVQDSSVYSYHSSKDLSGFLKEFNGRMFNNQSELYVMPSDEGEFRRLNVQHYAITAALDGLYPCKDIVEEILAPREDTNSPTILDLGCGSGIWAVEMAKKFPHCDVLGLDLAPAMFKLDEIPSNCRFEIDDINLGLSHYHEHFDLIHVRCIGSGIADFRKTMRDIEACLKPGGLVIFLDGDMGGYEEDLITPFPVGQEEEEGGDPTKGSWFHRIKRELRSAAMCNGTDCDAVDNSMDEGLWDHELIDPKTVQAASLNVPIGPWARASDPNTQQRLSYAESLNRQNSMWVSRAWHPMLIKHGIPQETLTKWSERIDEEMTSGRLRMAVRWRMTWGRRYKNSATAHVEGPPDGGGGISHQSNTNDISIEGPTDFKLFEIYRSREHANALAELRRQNASNLPIPTVIRIRNTQTSKPSSA